MTHAVTRCPHRRHAPSVPQTLQAPQRPPRGDERRPGEPCSPWSPCCSPRESTAMPGTWCSVIPRGPGQRLRGDKMPGCPMPSAIERCKSCATSRPTSRLGHRQRAVHIVEHGEDARPPHLHQAGSEQPKRRRGAGPSHSTARALIRRQPAARADLPLDQEASRLVPPEPAVHALVTETQ
jgi:hypothetical protein